MDIFVGILVFAALFLVIPAIGAYLGSALWWRRNRARYVLVPRMHFQVRPSTPPVPFPAPMPPPARRPGPQQHPWTGPLPAPSPTLKIRAVGPPFNWRPGHGISGQGEER